MARNTGFRSVVHQGHFAGKYQPLANDPYPVHSAASKSWQSGWHGAKRGERINKQGELVLPC